MRIFQFNKECGKSIEAFQSEFIMTRIVNHSGQIHIGCAYLEPKGSIGHHQAVVPQILLVVQGEGWVSGENNEKVHITAGQAAYWEKGEHHETVIETGMTAIIIEGEELNPALYMKERETV